MSYRCPLCGGRFDAGESCRQRYERALAKEFEDPAYGAVHNLTVAAYQLQHNGYSRDGWLWARVALAGFLAPDFSLAEFRRRQAPIVDIGNRAGSVTKGPKPEWFDQIAWTRTIADVRFDTAEDYSADVRSWASAVLADTETVLSALGR